jgi:hypothetical protein
LLGPRGRTSIPAVDGSTTNDPTGKVVLDPDTEVQHALRRLVQTFERTGSARAVVQASAAASSPMDPPAPP